jgi:hypothetical protein
LREGYEAEALPMELGWGPAIATSVADGAARSSLRGAGSPLHHLPTWVQA